MSKKEESQDASPVIKEEEPPFDGEGQVSPMGSVAGQSGMDPPSTGDIGGLAEFTEVQWQASTSAQYGAVGEIARRTEEAAQKLLDRLIGNDFTAGDLDDFRASCGNARAQLRVLLDGFHDNYEKPTADGA